MRVRRLFQMSPSPHFFLTNRLLHQLSVVEFATRDDAQKAIRDLNDTTLMGRPLFIREVRHRFLFPFKRSPVLTYYSFNNRTVKRKPVTEPLLFQDVRGTTDLELSVDLLAEEDLEDRDEVDSKAGSRADSREGSNKVDSKDLLRARGVTCTFKAYVRLFFFSLGPSRAWAHLVVVWI